jgi:hypothetical protein
LILNNSDVFLVQVDVSAAHLATPVPVASQVSTLILPHLFAPKPAEMQEDLLCLATMATTLMVMDAVATVE